MVPYEVCTYNWSMPYCSNFMSNIHMCDAALMSCEGAALPFQADANYGTWSIDFAF